MRNKCSGACKIDINEKALIITNICNTNIEHNYIQYQDFVEIMKNNTIKDLNFKEKKIQKYFVYYCLNNNTNIDNQAIKNKFSELTKLELKLNLTDLSNIGTKL